jgi:ABC-type sulfate/molybdate transport systems ATPase subunit
VTAPPPLLELRGITVDAERRTILELEHLTIAPGETLAILGANGAGKSTLLRVAGGLRRHDRGQVLLHGRPATPPQVRSVSAAVLQRPLLRRGTARANVETGLRFKRVPRAECRQRAGRWLERFGLERLADQPASSLSGGEAQRVSIARALALAPELLLLDEPFGALDAPTRAELLADLRDILAGSSTSALLVTHDRHEAAAVADRIAILHAGSLRELGTTPTVLEHPADADCARLLGFENVLCSELASRLLGRVTRHPLAVRAADCRLDPHGSAGTLERILPFGSVTRAIVTIDGTRILIDTPAPAPEWLTALEPGSHVDVQIDASAARVLP